MGSPEEMFQLAGIGYMLVSKSVAKTVAKVLILY